MHLPLPTIALAVLNVGLLVAVGAHVVRGSQREQLLSAQAGPVPATHLQFDMPNLITNLDSLRSQAVFYQSRNFYAPPPSAVAEQPVPDYRLTGSMSLPNRPLSALLMNNQTNARIKVAVGDELEGWVVSEVGPKLVTLHLGERIAEIRPGAVAGSPGIAIVSDNKPKSSASASGGIVRVPAGASITQPVVPSAPAASSSEARLYRPPGS